MVSYLLSRFLSHCVQWPGNRDPWCAVTGNTETHPDDSWCTFIFCYFWSLSRISINVWLTGKLVCCGFDPFFMLCKKWNIAGSTVRGALLGLLGRSEAPLSGAVHVLGSVLALLSFLILSSHQTARLILLSPLNRWRNWGSVRLCPISLGHRLHWFQVFQTAKFLTFKSHKTFPPFKSNMTWTPI